MYSPQMKRINAKRLKNQDIRDSFRVFSPLQISLINFFCPPINQFVFLFFVTDILKRQCYITRYTYIWIGVLFSIVDKTIHNDNMDFYDYKNMKNYVTKINRDIFVYLILEG